MHALGPYGSLQGTLLWGWEFLLLPPQPPWVLSIRGLRLYFPIWSPRLRGLLRSPPFVLVYLCTSVGPQGLLVVRLPALFVPHSGSLGLPWPHQSSPSRCPSLSLLPVWMYVSFLSTWCWTSLPFDFLSVLVVRGGAVCLPVPPSWFSRIFSILISISCALGINVYSAMLEWSIYQCKLGQVT